MDEGTWTGSGWGDRTRTRDPTQSSRPVPALGTQLLLMSRASPERALKAGREDRAVGERALTEFRRQQHPLEAFGSPWGEQGGGRTGLDAVMGQREGQRDITVWHKLGPR